jgi:flavin-binding protein dodecin
MSIARITEVKSSSTISFDDAIKVGIERAAKTIENIKGAWIADQEIAIEDGKITEYRVLMKITFILK